MQAFGLAGSDVGRVVEGIVVERGAVCGNRGGPGRSAERIEIAAAQRVVIRADRHHAVVVRVARLGPAADRVKESRSRIGLLDVAILRMLRFGDAGLLSEIAAGRNVGVDLLLQRLTP